MAHPDYDRGRASSTLVDSNESHRGTESIASQSQVLLPLRASTMRKPHLMSAKPSMRRMGSHRTSQAPSVISFDVDQRNDVFNVPVPTHGSPTEILSRRFDVWRKVLKDLITYFREIQKSYEARSKALYSLSNVATNITPPSDLMAHGGISDALLMLQDYQKKSISQSNRAKSIEEEIIGQLTGLRSDLAQKIKEIKAVSGDFKNSVEREVEGTRRAVRELDSRLNDRHPDAKTDPFLVRLGVDRQIQRQIEEENYLHRAFLNLETSGRELESIVVGEIQKAYSLYASIIKREADDAYETVESLKSGPVGMPKDTEWKAFVHGNDHFVDPTIALRRAESIDYPGKYDSAALEVKSGMLERKSKYLKSYTPGWYVLTSTHLHEFKSAERMWAQSPIMSLPLADQKLGSHSNADSSSSQKFMLKGRQSGGSGVGGSMMMHKSHAWVFRAESHETMMSWFEVIKILTESTSTTREAFIRRAQARSTSGISSLTDPQAILAPGKTINGDMEILEHNKESQRAPHSSYVDQVQAGHRHQDQSPRPAPGGRFPSNLSLPKESRLPATNITTNSTRDSTRNEENLTKSAALAAFESTKPNARQSPSRAASSTGSVRQFKQTAELPGVLVPEKIKKVSQSSAANANPATTSSKANQVSKAKSQSRQVSDGNIPQSPPTKKHNLQAQESLVQPGIIITGPDQSGESTVPTNTNLEPLPSTSTSTSPSPSLSAQSSTPPSSTLLQKNEPSAGIESSPDQLDQHDSHTPRPKAGQHQQSAMTISQLDIPGKFPGLSS